MSDQLIITNPITGETYTGDDLDNFLNSIGETVESVGEKVNTIGVDIKTTVQEHPYMTTVAAGLLVVGGCALIVAFAPESLAAEAILAVTSALRTAGAKLLQSLINLNKISPEEMAELTEHFFKVGGGKTPKFAIAPFTLISDLVTQGTQTISPIVLDLDGDGIETVAVANGVYFDHNNDGFKEKTGWASADDGLLVLDRNGNGTIDSGRELFGTNTEYISGILAESGYEALETVDSNHDGVINSSDAQFANLKVWKDLNQNGVSDSGELLTLAEAGIASITLTHSDTEVTDANGNIQTEIGTYTKTNSTTAAIADYNFVVDTMNTTNSTTVTIPEEIAVLPNIAGSGTTSNNNIYEFRHSLKLCA